MRILSSERKIIEVNKLKVGRYIIYEDEAYRIVSIVHSRAGKHGHAKSRIEAVSIIGGKKISIVKGGGSRIETPIISKRSAQVLTIRTETEQRGIEVIEKTFANVMDVSTYETFDLRVPDDLKNRVKDGSEIIYWDVMGNKLMQQVKK